jgi:hypothetical protein
MNPTTPKGEELIVRVLENLLTLVEANRPEAEQVEDARAAIAACNRRALSPVGDGGELRAQKVDLRHARAFYLAMYGDEGGVWEAVDLRSQDTWKRKAARFLALSPVSVDGNQLVQKMHGLASPAETVSEGLRPFASDGSCQSEDEETDLYSAFAYRGGNP